MQEVEVALYPHVLRTSGLGMSHEVLPVTVCKQASLSKAVEIIETGTQQLVEEMKTFIEGHSSTVVEELFLTELLRRARARALPRGQVVS
jgi:hypothetical protein